MNRYPLWKYVLIAFAILFGILYASPTLLRTHFGEAFLVQVSSSKQDTVDASATASIERVLTQAGISVVQMKTTAKGISIEFADKDTQQKARTLIDKELNAQSATYSVSFNSISKTPGWLRAIGARPVNLGLDLRGGVHFLLQVDMKTALSNRVDALSNQVRALLIDKKIHYRSISRENQTLRITFADGQAMASALKELRLDGAEITEVPGSDNQLLVNLAPQAAQEIQELALKQNMSTLHNRINALGVAEPIIQQQGLDRIVVELPGVDDTTQARALLGRTATLQIRMEDDSPAAALALRGQGPIPLGSTRFTDAEGFPYILKNDVLLTGENLKNAQPGRADKTGVPAVFLALDSHGTNVFYDLTLKNRNKRMAIVLFEQGRGEVITAPKINEPIPGGNVQISGSMSAKEAENISLLLRSGSLAAPMEIVEEETIGPTLGEKNIESGVKSVIYGFAAVAVFMCFYYMLFGLISSISMVINLLLLISVLSLLQATLTLPGIAAMALAMGMAIDANVLINERIREELRAGATPQMAIMAGYEHAWRTILDSNVTSLIAGIALLTCDAGPIRGFAVVHCLGILTSLFSAVFVSRGLVNLWYGRKRKLQSLSIGQVWKPQQD